MATERLFQFPSKPSPVPADIIYIGDSANEFNEVNSTIAQVIAAYPNLSSIAGLNFTANTFIYSNNSNVLGLATVTALAISLLADSTTAAMQSTLALVPGTNVQAYSAALASIAGLTTAANELLYTTASNTYAVITAAASSVLVTNSGNVPSLSQTLPATVQGNITALGTLGQALNMGTHLINNVVDPVSAQDAMTLNYAGTHYLALAGGTMAGNINMGGFKATNAAEPTLSSDYATKNYVDQTALNGTSVYAASAATLGTVTQSGAGAGATITNGGTQLTFAVDGISPPVGSNVLIKNTATGMTAANEGIYTVTNAGSNSTNWVLTRATSYDTPTEINNTGLIVVQNGSTLAGSAWYNTATIVTVDTTSFSYSKFGTSGTVTSVTAGSGLTGGTITSTGTIALDPSITIGASAASGSLTISPSNGYVQRPKNPGFSAYVTSTSSAVTGDNTTYQIATFTKQFDVATNFNATTGTFTAPVAGVYCFYASVMLGGLGAGNTLGQAYITASGNLYYLNLGSWASMKTSAGQLAVTGYAIVNMAANDTATLSIVETNNGSKNVTVLGTTNTPTTFGGYLIG
jgi:hypothetical protein